MNITIIHGQSHKGSTYNISKILAHKIGGNVTEYFLPKDFNNFCLGCANCITKSETLCPHYQSLLPITNSIDNADIIILDSPVYVYHVTGSMKAFLDHYGYRWIVHRPEESMFKKQAVCISTAAGGGMKSTNKDMADSLSFWGISCIYKLGFAVRAINWDKVDAKIKEKIDKKTTIVAKRITNKYNKVKPNLKVKFYYYLIRLLQKKEWNPPDVAYWQEKGWNKQNHPW